MLPSTATHPDASHATATSIYVGPTRMSPTGGTSRLSTKPTRTPAARARQDQLLLLLRTEELVVARQPLRTQRVQRCVFRMRVQSWGLLRTAGGRE